MTKSLLKTLGLLALVGGCYFPHRYFLLPLFDDVSLSFLNFSYTYNIVASLIIVVNSFVIARFSKDYLGFLFMAFGMFKLIIFAFFANKMGFDLNATLVLHFFVPYLLCVGSEMFFIIPILKDDKPENIN